MGKQCDLNGRFTQKRKERILLADIFGFIRPGFETSVSEISSDTPIQWWWWCVAHSIEKMTSKIFNSNTVLVTPQTSLSSFHWSCFLPKNSESGKQTAVKDKDLRGKCMYYIKVFHFFME